MKKLYRKAAKHYKTACVLLALLFILLNATSIFLGFRILTGAYGESRVDELLGIGLMLLCSFCGGRMQAGLEQAHLQYAECLEADSHEQ